MTSRQVVELNDALIDLQAGEAVLMKQFLQTKEYAIIDKNKKGMHPTDYRYLFDWQKMKIKLSSEAQAFYKQVEIGKELRTKGWYQFDPTDAKKPKAFIGFSDADCITYHYLQSAIVGFNAWIESETEVVRFKADNRKQRWCKVKILNITMNSSTDYPVPTVMNVIYKRVELPSGIL